VNGNEWFEPRGEERKRGKKGLIAASERIARGGRKGRWGGKCGGGFVSSSVLLLPRVLRRKGKGGRRREKRGEKGRWKEGWDGLRWKGGGSKGILTGIRGYLERRERGEKKGKKERKKKIEYTLTLLEAQKKGRNLKIGVKKEEKKKRRGERRRGRTGPTGFSSTFFARGKRREGEKKKGKREEGRGGARTRAIYMSSHWKGWERGEGEGGKKGVGGKSLYRHHRRGLRRYRRGSENCEKNKKSGGRKGKGGGGNKNAYFT